jgi:hypothetical protein
MPHAYSTALSIARALLRIFRGLNLIMGLMVLGWFLATFIWAPFFQHFFSVQPARLDPDLLLPALRVWMLLTLPALAAVHLLLTRLLAMVETVRAGNPFVPDNAVRLKTIAWCMLGLQLFDLVCGAMAAIMNAAGSRIEWHWWPTGWLAVALLFVLAQVFEEGTRMRGELEAMI